MISKYLLERAIDMVSVASDDPTRYPIAGVLIKSKAGQVTLVATNGHMLMERVFQGDAKCPEGNYMLRKDEVPALKLVLKECKSEERIEASIDSTGGLFIGALTKARISKQEQDYPDYKNVIPNPTLRVAITVNAEYLAAIAKVLKDGEKRKSGNIRIVFDPTKPMNAILVEQEGVEGTTAVVMPVRDKGTAHIAADMAERLNPEPATEKESA